MRPINATSLTLDVNGWLENSRHPRILHVFDRACNVINERREILSVVTTQIGNGPFNLVIPRLRKSLERFPSGDVSQQTSEVFFNQLNVESLASIHENQLMIGNFAINTANARLWNPRPNWEMLHVKREKILKQLTQLQITDSCETSQWDQVSDSLVSALSAALATADISTAKAVASRLAGLGMGLTPAGDDFIMGALYAAWIIHPADVARALAEAIANTAAPLTTSLSAAWLRSAAKGDAGILWHQFFDALISSDPMQIQEYRDKILAVGETSGSDALAGFMGPFRSWLEYRSNLWEYNQT